MVLLQVKNCDTFVLTVQRNGSSYLCAWLQQKTNMLYFRGAGKWDAKKENRLTLFEKNRKGKNEEVKQTCLTSPFQIQWAAKNPITAGTIYKRAGWKQGRIKRKVKMLIEKIDQQNSMTCSHTLPVWLVGSEFNNTTVTTSFHEKHINRRKTNEITKPVTWAAWNQFITNIVRPMPKVYPKNALLRNIKTQGQCYKDSWREKHLSSK